MKDEQLESLLRGADQSAGCPSDPDTDLAERARDIHGRRQLRRERVKVIGGLIGCYLAGLITMWLCFPSTPVPVADSVDQPRDSKTDNIAPSVAERQKVDEDKVAEPDQQEQMPAIEIAIKSPYQLFRELGDSSHGRNDFDSAVSFYKQALNVATEDERKIAHSKDNFLLMTLKKDRFGDLQQTKPGDAI